MNKFLVIFSFFVLICSSCKKESLFSTNTVDTFYVRNGGSDMPAFVRGNTASKVFIIYLQGGPGNGSLSEEGAYYTYQLKKNYAMVYWDQRHTGNSHGHYTAGELNIETVVGDLYALVKTIKHRYGEDNSIFFMGASWGGLLSLSYLLEKDYQKELNGWISVAGANYTSTIFKDINEWAINIGDEEIAQGKNVPEWTEIIEYLSQFDQIENLTQEDEEFWVRGNYLSQIQNELINDYLGIGFLPTGKVPFHTNDPLIGNFNDNNMPMEFREDVLGLSYNSDQLSKITIPSLLIYGKYDSTVPAVIGQRIHDGIASPMKDFTIYSKSGHSPMYTEPDLFVSDVSEFIDLNK